MLRACASGARADALWALPQFLESYKSVTLQMMASAFGVSPAFLDGELSTFIAAGRLNCKIDKAHAARTRSASRLLLLSFLP